MMKRSIIYSTLFALVYQGVWATGAFAAVKASAVATKEPLMLSSTQGKTEHGLSPVRDTSALKVDGDRFTYDALGRVIARAHDYHDKDGKLRLWHETYSYGSSSHMHGKVRNDGTKFDYSYSNDGTLVKQSWTGPSGSGHIDWTFDHDTGVMTSVTQNDEKEQYTHFPDGTLHTTIYPDGRTVSTQIDQFNRVFQDVNAVGQTESYHYNSNNQLADVYYETYHLINDYSDTTKKINHQIGVFKQYQLNGHIVKNYYNGFNQISATETTLDSQPALVNTYDYDSRHRLTTEVKSSGIDNTDDNLKFTEDYQYDSLSQLTNEKTIPGGSQEISPTNTSYVYDGNGNVIGNVIGIDKNVVSSPVIYNALDQRMDQSYDENGRVTEDKAGNSYVYNGLDQLLKRTGADGLVVSYGYYPDGLLATRTVDGTTETFYYRNGRVNAINTQRNGDSSWTGFLLVSGKRLAAYSSDPNVEPTYYLLTHQSSGASMRAGALSGEHYDAYGKNTPLSNNKGESSSPLHEQADKSFTWDQEYADPVTGLTYLRARYYSPDSESFMSMDSAFVDNKYNFGNGDPINQIDPSGNMPESIKRILDIAIYPILAVATIAVVYFQPELAPEAAKEFSLWSPSTWPGAQTWATWTTAQRVAVTQAAILGSKDLAEGDLASVAVDGFIVGAGIFSVMGNNLYKVEQFAGSTEDLQAAAKVSYERKMMVLSFSFGGVAYGMNVGIRTGDWERAFIDGAVAGITGLGFGGLAYSYVKDFVNVQLGLENIKTMSLGKATSRAMLAGFSRSLIGNSVGSFTTHAVDGAYSHENIGKSLRKGLADMIYSGIQGLGSGMVTAMGSDWLKFSWGNLKAPIQMITQKPFESAFG